MHLNSSYVANSHVAAQCNDATKTPTKAQTLPLWESSMEEAGNEVHHLLTQILRQANPFSNPVSPAAHHCIFPCMVHHNHRRDSPNPMAGRANMVNEKWNIEQVRLDIARACRANINEAVLIAQCAKISYLAITVHYCIIIVHSSLTILKYKGTHAYISGMQLSRRPYILISGFL